MVVVGINHCATLFHERIYLSISLLTLRVAKLRDQDMSGESPWLSLTEAAQRSGLSREAVRARARRGLIPSRKGNSRETLVQLPAESVQAMSSGDQDMTGSESTLVADLLAEVGDLRELLARAQAERDAAESVALAQVEAAKAQAAAMRELAEARRPWWRRWRG
jgi:hypothetical protein